MPDIVDAVSIAARGDVIVPVPRSEAPGMDEVVVPLVGRTAHSDLPGSDEATRALGLALAGLPPGCQSFGDALADQVVGEGISLAEDLAGAVALLVGGARGRAGRPEQATSIDRRPGDRLSGSHTTPCTRAIPRSPLGAPGPAPALCWHSEPREGSPSWPSSP